MNIDFHYGIIYVVARLAGMGRDEAETIAHACEYVDDATTPGILEFKDGQTFARFASAHEALDYSNVLDSDNRMVWAPFHFLPGNEGASFEQRVVCRKNSAVARAMVRRFLEQRGKDNDLHRLGVLLHTYVDTWAHQGFSGTSSPRNAVHHLEGDDHPHDTWLEKLKEQVGNVLAAIEGETVHNFVKVGHGAALHFPDLPWARWRYRNGFDEQIERENLPDFVDAAAMAYKVIGAFRAGRTDFEAFPDMPADRLARIRDVLSENCSHNSNHRLEVINERLAGGALPEVPERIPEYIPKGRGSWKHAATGIEADDDGAGKPVWSEAFEGSDYRKFHDAVKEHRMDVTHVVLPSFGIRLA